jgi:hypothetical protein
MLNYVTLEQFFKKMLTTGLMPGGDWQLNPVSNPEWISVFNLPQEMKDAGRQGINNIIEYLTSKDKLVRTYKKRNYNFEHTINNIKSFPDLVDSSGVDFNDVRPEFVCETRRLDQLRKETFVEVFPELRTMYE